MENHHFNRYCNNLPEGRGYNGIFCGIFSRNKQSHGVFMGADDIRAISMGNPLDFCCVHQNAQQYSERPSPHRQVYNPKVFDCGTYEKPRIHEDHFDEQHHS